MNDTYDSKILDHYRNEAARHGDAATSTMADNRTRELETEFLLAFVARYAPAGALIADVGCGNGYTLAQVRKALPEAQLVGLEFTPELRRIAETRFAGDTRTTIADADVRKPFHGPHRFDAIICQRVLINLLDPRDQALALHNLAGALKSGGHIALVEAFTAGLTNLNAARSEFGLEPIPPAYHNLYLNDDFFEAEPTFEPVADETFPANFLSTHYFVTRVLHPICLGSRDLVRNSHFVRFFSAALQQSVGDYSPVRARIFRKREGVE